MRKAWAVLVLAAACSFAPKSAGSGGPGGPDAATATARCSVDDPSLKLCIDFSGQITPTMTVPDLSGLGHDATATMIAAANRNGDQAVALTAASSIGIPASSDLMLGAPVTVELWVAPTLPLANRAYVLDGGSYYNLTLDTSAAITCNVAGTSVVGPALSGTTWSHVACVYDGATLQLFVDGAVAGCQTAQGGGSATMAGMAIGSKMTSVTSFSQQLVGAIDDVHVYASAVAAATICTHAGNGTCTTTCPAHGGGG